MNISENGINLIKSFEGFRSESYQDSAGIWTIGYGTIKYPSGSSVCQHHECSEEQALEWLKLDVQHAVNGINRLVWNKPLNQSQFDALVSFAYNLGISSLSNSGLYRIARQNPDDKMIWQYNVHEPIRSSEFTKWVFAGGRVVSGLLKRRMKEADLYGS